MKNLQFTCISFIKIINKVEVRFLQAFPRRHLVSFHCLSDQNLPT